jgi:hypothetical protein
VGLALAVHLLRGGSAARATLRASWLPLTLVLLSLAGFLAAHNKAVTGHALRLPYLEYHQQYEVVPLFLFQSLREEPSYNHSIQRAFFSSASGHNYRARQSLSGFLKGSARTLSFYVGFIVGWSFTVIGLAALLQLAERRVRFALACSAFFLVALCIESFTAPHYAAPFVACGIFLWTRGLQTIWEWRGGLRTLRLAVVLLVALGTALHGVKAVKHARHRASYDLYRRADIIESLEKREGDHLVLVRYGEYHNPHIEWVQNEADIEGSRVAWAREMNPELGAALVQGFPERTPWLLHADRTPRVVVPYTRN